MLHASVSLVCLLFEMRGCLIGSLIARGIFEFLSSRDDLELIPLSVGIKSVCSYVQFMDDAGNLT